MPCCYRLVEEQRQKNAEAEQLEAKAVRARREAKAAADRIHQCQGSLQAAEHRLAAKKHEISHNVGPPWPYQTMQLCSLCTYLLRIAVNRSPWFSLDVGMHALAEAAMLQQGKD